MPLSRRDFLGSAATTAGAALASPAAALPWITVAERTPPAPAAPRPVVISSDNGYTADAGGRRGIQAAYDLLARGADIRYHDPYVSELPQFGLKSVEDPYDPGIDLAVIVTAHHEVDHARIAQNAPQTLDLRGVTREVESAGVKQL